MLLFLCLFFSLTRVHRENNPNDVLPSSDGPRCKQSISPCASPPVFARFGFGEARDTSRALLCSGAGALPRPPCPLFYYYLITFFLFFNIGLIMAVMVVLGWVGPRALVATPLLWATPHP